MAGVCGRDCGSCEFRTEYGCKGCLETEGRPVWGECRVVRCCHGKGFAICGECPSAETCAAADLAGSQRERFPQEEAARREQEEARQAERRADMARKAPVLGKWLLILFWLNIAGEVTGLLEKLPLGRGGALVIGLLNIANGVAALMGYWALSKLSARFRSVWVWKLVCLGTALLALGAAALDRDGRSGLLTIGGILVLVAAGFGVAVIYQFCEALAEQLDGEDQYLADNWRLLRKWLLGSLGALVGGLLLAFLAGVLGALVLVGAALVLIGSAIAELVLIWQSARFFREQAAASALPSPET